VIVPIFEYDDAAVAHLSRKDKKLGAAMAAIGRIEREVTPDPFQALVMSIISQQISGKAVRTIRSRLDGALGTVTPETLDAADATLIQSCGMSFRKTAYLKNLAEAVSRNRLDLARLRELPDGEVVSVLSSLSGIGVWTAEMFLIFCLCRPDVLSWGDLAIRRGMMNLYGLKNLDREKFERCRKRYSPYGSVASLYLWALSH
jgi:3-methyladenine DNA glycosylase/8-oxoguanine DNA glycosylase